MKKPPIEMQLREATKQLELLQRAMKESSDISASKIQDLRMQLHVSESETADWRRRFDELLSKCKSFDEK